jgi:hypothetical protein
MNRGRCTGGCCCALQEDLDARIISLPEFKYGNAWMKRGTAGTVACAAICAECSDDGQGLETAAFSVSWRPTFGLGMAGKCQPQPFRLTSAKPAGTAGFGKGPCPPQ